MRDLAPKHEEAIGVRVYLELSGQPPTHTHQEKPLRGEGTGMPCVVMATLQYS